MHEVNVPFVYLIIQNCFVIGAYFKHQHKNLFPMVPIFILLITVFLWSKSNTPCCKNVILTLRRYCTQCMGFLLGQNKGPSNEW